MKHDHGSIGHERVVALVGPDASIDCLAISSGHDR
jgi:hypothetical protein